MKFFLKTRYFFDRVVEVKYNSYKDVYSLRVEGYESFVANEFVNHNTECRLTEIAEKMLEDIEKDVVDFQPNFDSSKEEPIVLPAKIPPTDKQMYEHSSWYGY